MLVKTQIKLYDKHEAVITVITIFGGEKNYTSSELSNI